MSRKTKTQIAVAFIVAGSIAYGLWPINMEPEVRITFDHFSPKNFSQVWLKITNTASNGIVLISSAQELQGQQWQTLPGFSRTAHQTLASHHAMTEFIMVAHTNRWRFCINYYFDRSRSIPFRTRYKLGQFVQNHHFVGLGQWIMPGPRWETNFGPEMLGNTPAPLATTR